MTLLNFIFGALLMITVGGLTGVASAELGDMFRVPPLLATIFACAIAGINNFIIAKYLWG